MQSEQIEEKFYIQLNFHNKMIPYQTKYKHFYGYLYS